MHKVRFNCGQPLRRTISAALPRGAPLVLMVAALFLASIAVGPAAEKSAGDRDHAPADSADLDYASQLPRIAPREPSDAIESFQIRRGFRIEQVAAEPLVADPVAMAFDADGRLFVVEMCGYSEQPDENLGVITLLEDVDGDGRFEKSTRFAEGFSWPTAVICYDGGIFVGDAPDMLYLRDTNGDGKADERRRVFTGFGKSNVQGLLNSFAWGLDNRIHGAASSSGGKVRAVDQPETNAISLSGRDFAFDPKTLEIEATSGGAQHGMSFDNWGTQFVCHNSDHIQQVMFQDRYAARNPYFPVPGARASIAVEGPQAEVYRISPVEPWRIVRTRLRAKGIVPGIVEGGGRPAGYFTSATGVTIYRGDAWPAEFLGNAFVGDVGSNIIHRKVIDESHIEYVAKRAEEGVEFVASSDIWFRPVQFANSPDGNLYVADMYREVIEHPLSLPPIIKKHLDLTSGRDRGRIYRIAADGSALREPPKLSAAPTAELVALLEHPNGWHRDTASRLLYERQDKSAVEPLKKLAAESKSPIGRFTALYALSGLHALTEKELLPALDDSHPRVRQHAVLLSEDKGRKSPAVAEKLLALADDRDVHARYQLAFSLGELTDPRRLPALAQLVRGLPDDPWIGVAVQSSLESGAAEVLATLFSDTELDGHAAVRKLLENLISQVAVQRRPAEVAKVVAALATRGSSDPLAMRLSRTLVAGLARGDQTWRKELPEDTRQELASLGAKLLVSASSTAADESATAQARIEAIRALSIGQFGQVAPILTKLLDLRVPQDLQLAALATLSAYDQAEVGRIVLEGYQGFGPTLRRQAMETLFARPERLTALLDAVEQSELAPSDVDPARVRMLLESKDPQLRYRAQELFGSVKLARRQDVVEAYRSSLETKGDRERGKKVFTKECSVCHKLEGQGHEIGPNLATIQNRGAETILLNVLDPNREVNPQYLNYVLVTDDGRQLTGMILSETATSVTLGRAEGASDTVLRVNIDQLQSTGQSLMPEGLEKTIDPAAMADLIAYLTSVE